MIRAPIGYKFILKNSHYIKGKTIFLLKNNKNLPDYVGRIDLHEISNKLFETHSLLNSNLRGKGYGVILYSKAIEYALNKGFKICSSIAPSDSAHRVWRSKRLKNKFKILIRHKRYQIFNKNFGYNTRYWAYKK